MKKQLLQISLFVTAFCAAVSSMMRCSQKAAERPTEEPTPLTTARRRSRYPPLRRHCRKRNGTGYLLKWLPAKGMHSISDTLDLSKVVVSQDWAELGFYGEDRYKIEPLLRSDQRRQRSFSSIASRGQKPPQKSNHCVQRYPPPGTAWRRSSDPRPDPIAVGDMGGTASSTSANGRLYPRRKTA